VLPGGRAPTAAAMAAMFSTSILERQSTTGTHRSSVASSSAPGGDLDNDTMFQDLVTLTRFGAPAPQPEAAHDEVAPEVPEPEPAQPAASRPSLLRSPTPLSRFRTGASRSPASVGPGPGSEPGLRPRSLVFSDKENRVPLVGEGGTGKRLATSWTQLREMDQLKRQLVQEEKLRNQAEAQVSENRKFRKSVAEVQQQLQTQTSRIEELQQQCEELEASRAEEHARAKDRAAALDRAHAALADREREVAALQLDSAKVGELKRRCDELEALRVEEQGRESEQTAALASAHAALEECERKVAALQLDTTRSTELQQRCNELEALRLEEQGRASDQAAALDRALAALEAREREVVALRLDSAEVEMLQRRCDELEALRIEEQGRANDALSSANADLDDRGREVAELQVDLDHALQELQEREAWAQESSKRLERMALYLEDERAKVRLEEAPAPATPALQARSAVLAEMITNLEAGLSRSTGQLWEELERIGERAASNSARMEGMRARREAEVDAAPGDEPAQTRSAATSPLPGSRERLQDVCVQVSHDIPSGCDDENQELLSQNRELALTLQLFKQDCELLSAENKSLHESLAAFEANLDRVTSQNAKLLGHSNHRQKIHYTFKLKEENGRLREELRRAQHKVLQLEGSRRGQDLVDALAPFSAEPRQGRRSAPNLAALATAPAAAPARQAKRRAEGPEAQRPAEEAQRRCRAQERILERVSLDFRHFTALIERAVSDEAPGACGDAAALLARLRSSVANGPRAARAADLHTEGPTTGASAD